MSEDVIYWIRNKVGKVKACHFYYVVLDFYIDDEPAQAIAHVDVCYDADGEIRNFHGCDSYCAGDHIRFDAIHAPHTELPDIWKVGTAWTDRKHTDSLDISNDEDEILEKYDDCLGYKCLLDGYTGIPDKDLESEEEAIEYFYGRLKQLICRRCIYNIEDDDLEELLDNADAEIVDYIDNCYGSVRDFFECHSKVFRVTRSNMIFPCRLNQMHSYINDLPLQLDEEEDENWDSGSNESSNDSDDGYYYEDDYY